MLAENLIGQVLGGRYEILAVLGTGGMGTVFKCRQTELERFVALKLLHSTQLTDGDGRIRFEQEGRLLSALHHRHIIVFYHFGIYQNAYPYIVMEYLQGTSLRSLLLAESKIPWKRAVAIAMQICDAMQHAHDMQIVHRDLKPDNIMLLPEPEPDFVKIFDFGLAKALPEGNQARQKLTQTGTLLGSVHYMSPEQCQGKSADNRSDIYALGCLLYESITGEPPFMSDNPVGLIYKQVNEYPKSFLDVLTNKDVPRDLEYVLSKSMAKIPEERYQTMSEFQADLKNILQGKNNSIQAKESTFVKRNPVRTESKSYKFAFVAMVSGLALLLLVSFLFLHEPSLAAIVTLIAETGNKKDVSERKLWFADQLARRGRYNAALDLYLQPVQSPVAGRDDGLLPIEILVKVAKIYAVQKRPDDLRRTTIKALVLLNNELNKYLHAGPLDSRETQLLKDVFKLLNASVTSHSPEVGSLCEQLKTVCKGRHDYSSALLIQEYIVDLAKRKYGKRDWAYPKCLIEKGELLILTGRKTQGFALIEEAMNLAVEYNGIQSVFVVDREYQVAEIYFDNGDKVMAKKHWQRADAIAASFTGEGKKAVYNFPLARAKMNFLFGNKKAGEDDFRKSLVDIEKMKGLQDPSYLEACNQVAGLLTDKLNDYSEATKVIDETISRYEAKLSTDPSLCQTYHFLLVRLGRISSESGDKQAALRAFHKANTLFPPTTRETCPAQEIGLAEEAVCQNQLGNIAEAEVLAQKRLALIRKFMPENKSKLVDALWQLSDIYGQTRRLSEQVTIGLEADDVASDFPTKINDRAWHCLWLCGAYQELGKPVEAERSLKKAFTLQALAKLPDKDLLISLNSEAVGYYWRSREYRTCLSYAKKQMNLSDFSSPKNIDRFILGAKTTIECYLKLNDIAEAKQCLASWKMLYWQSGKPSKNHDDRLRAAQALIVDYEQKSTAAKTGYQ